MASFIEADRAEVDAERSQRRAAREAGKAEARQELAWETLALSSSFGGGGGGGGGSGSFLGAHVSGDAVLAGEIGAIVAVVTAGGKPIPGTTWVEYIDEDDYVGTVYYYNLDTGGTHRSLPLFSSFHSYGSLFSLFLSLNFMLLSWLIVRCAITRLRRVGMGGS